MYRIDRTDHFDPERPLSSIDKYFSSADLRAVEAAVEEAEAATAGEIVTYIAVNSDAYHLASWKGATLGAVSFSVLAAAALSLSEPWAVWLEAWIVVPPMLGGALGYLLAVTIPKVRRALIDQEVIEQRVRSRARQVFLGEEVFNTRDRTGILLYLSLFERRLEVVADTGIVAAVPQAAWDGVGEGLIAAVRSGRAGDGLVLAVGACGRILAQHRVDRRADDANELVDVPSFDGGPESRDDRASGGKEEE